MALSLGRNYLAIPGPSVIPESVLRSMHRAAPNIYEGELIEITESLIPDLKHDENYSRKLAEKHGPSNENGHKPKIYPSGLTCHFQTNCAHSAQNYRVFLLKFRSLNPCPFC